MSIIKQYHKDTNTTYVYESESYWDPELKQARSQRKCIGKINPETGEMIPTGKRGRKKATPDALQNDEEYKKLLEAYNSTQKENLSLNSRIRSLEKELSDTTKQLRRYQATVKRIKELSAEL